MYFRNWGGASVPIVLQPVGGPPTRAARYVERLRYWLSGARVRTCRKGAQAGLPDNVWQCWFDRRSRVSDLVDARRHRGTARPGRDGHGGTAG